MTELPKDECSVSSGIGFIGKVSKMIKTMLTKYGLLLVLTASIFLLDCATTQKLSITDRKKIESIYINTNVEKVMYKNYGSAANKILEIFSEQNNIFIDGIVVEELRTALRQSGKLPITGSPSQSSATLNISSIIYGFSEYSPFSSRLTAFVSIKCTIINNSGTIIWSATSPTSDNTDEKFTLDEMKANPKLIENAWRNSSKGAIAYIIEEL
jgi:hypothetical protein